MRGEKEGELVEKAPDESRVVTMGPDGSGVMGGHVLCPNQAVGRLVLREAPTGTKGAQLSKTGAVPPPPAGHPVGRQRTVMGLS